MCSNQHENFFLQTAIVINDTTLPRTYLHIICWNKLLDLHKIIKLNCPNFSSFRRCYTIDSAKLPDNSGIHVLNIVRYNIINLAADKRRQTGGGTVKELDKARCRAGVTYIKYAICIATIYAVPRPTE